MTDMTPTRLVFIGTCTLEDRKPGQLWVTEERALKHRDDAEALRRSASPFSKDKRTYTVGAVYETPAIVDEQGAVTNITRSLVYKAMVDTPATAALQLEEKGVRAMADAKREEEKARKNPAYASVIRDLARIVSAAPFSKQDRVIAGIMLDLRREALELHRRTR
jgi:hypothetical protein